MNTAKETLMVFGAMELANINAENKKKGRGRPRRESEVVTVTQRIDVDIYEWLQANRGRKSLNQFINDIIRKEAGL